MKTPEIKKFKNKTERNKYIIKSESVVNEFDVALSKVYHKMDKRNKILKLGDKIVHEDIPYGYFKYKGIIYPVYNDDPSQQDLIYLNGEWIGGGNFNSHPVEEFIYEIERRKR